MLVVVLLLIPLQWVPALTIGGYEVKRVALLSDVIDEENSGGDGAEALPEVPPLPVVPALATPGEGGGTATQTANAQTQPTTRPLRRALPRYWTIQRREHTAWHPFIAP